MSLSRSETGLLLACLALLLSALLGPPVLQANAHDFADVRMLGALPHARDVLSNLPFALAGACGLFFVARVRPPLLDSPQRAWACLFFGGLLLTAAGSSWYHIAPDDFGLAVDRGAMGVAFAAFLALLATGRVSPRSGTALGSTLLALAPASVLVWFHTGNVLPWALLQFGGMALLLWVLATTRPLPGALPVRWSLVLLT